MKQICTVIACVFALFTASAQENNISTLEVGDVLVLGEPAGSHYKYVDVPRKNFIIKRGGIADMSSLSDRAVVITDISYGKETKITLKRKDGKKFFRVYNTFTANAEDALENGELRLAGK